jgi:hypothetical protein
LGFFKDQIALSMTQEQAAWILGKAFKQCSTQVLNVEYGQYAGATIERIDDLIKRVEELVALIRMSEMTLETLREAFSRLGIERTIDWNKLVVHAHLIDAQRILLLDRRLNHPQHRRGESNDHRCADIRAGLSAGFEGRLERVQRHSRDGSMIGI